jgi:hypothetical protein
MLLSVCAVFLVAAIVYVQYAKKREGLISPTCKKTTQLWDTQGPDIFTPVCATMENLHDGANSCKPYGREGCIAPYEHGACPGTLEYKDGKCVPPPI